MKRNNVQTVTMPVLIRAGTVGEADGWCTFLPTEFGESLFVRVVTKRDAHRWQRTELTGADHSLFIGVSQLKWAYDEDDEFTLQRAYEKLQPHVRGLPSPTATLVKLGPKASLLIGGQSLASIPSAYSLLTTELLKSARFVMWYTEDKRFLPALYCSDKKTAVFAMQFMGRILVCPECDTPFIPSAGNVGYCCLKHRESYRVKRFRWRAKRSSEEDETRKTLARARTGTPPRKVAKRSK